MQFDDAGTIKAPVRWYFCKPGALLFEGGNAFASSNWAVIPRQGSGIGEQWDSSFAWDRGDPPAGASGLGDPCGDPLWWANGVPSGSPRLTLSPGGLAQCCRRGGGLFLGGTSFTGRQAVGTLYLRFGATSRHSPIDLTATGGFRGGATSTARLDATASGGMAVGAGASCFVVSTHSGGDKVGGTFGGHVTAPVSGGAKLGASTAVKFTSGRNGGVKLGASSSTTSGILATHTCPGQVIPTVLHTTAQGGGTIALTYSAANNWWFGQDTTVPVNVILEAFTVASPVITSNTLPLHCSRTNNSCSVVCSPLSISGGFNFLGSTCPIQGTYSYTITP